MDPVLKVISTYELSPVQICFQNATCWAEDELSLPKCQFFETWVLLSSYCWLERGLIAKVWVVFFFGFSFSCHFHKGPLSAVGWQKDFCCTWNVKIVSQWSLHNSNRFSTIPGSVVHRFILQVQGIVTGETVI